MKQDREAVKTLAISIGVREAARRLGLNEDTVCSWAKREAWFTPKPHPPDRGQSTLQAMQATPSGALTDVLAEDNKASKIAWSKAGRKAAEHFAKLRPTVDKDRSAAAKNWHSVAAGTHGWNEQQGQTQFSLNVLNLGQLQIGVQHDTTLDTDA